MGDNLWWGMIGWGCWCRCRSYEICCCQMTKEKGVDLFMGEGWKLKMGCGVIVGGRWIWCGQRCWDFPWPHITTYYPYLSKLKCILREGFHIPSSEPTIHIFLKKELYHQLLQTTISAKSLSVTASVHIPSPPWACYKTCPIHIPIQSFTSPNTNLTFHQHPSWL